MSGSREQKAQAKTMQKEMKKKSRKINLEMNLLMSITMSLCLSLAGTLSSGHFAFVEWLISFAVSFVVSFIIGLLIPMKKIQDFVLYNHNLKRGGLCAHLVGALVSDLVYTPIMTLIMVFIAWTNARKHLPPDARLPFLPMFLKSLLVCFVVGYIVILIVTPIYLKILTKHNGLGKPSNSPDGPPGR